MKRLPAVLACLSGPAGADELDIREASETHVLAIVGYSNDAGQDSRNAEHILTLGDVTVTVRITVGTSGPEIIQVMPSNDLVAVPADAEVPDGEEIEIQIVRPMF